MRSLFATAIVALLLLPAGCSQPGVKKVTGKVTLDGNPLAGADVQFVPKEDLTLGEFGGQTNEQGDFSISVGGPGMTAKPGLYVVLITKGGIPGVTKKPRSEEDLKEVMKRTAPGVAGQELPAVYGDKASSPFTVEIKEGKTDLEPFHLVTKP
jgi:hypothetical protein